MLFIGPEVTAEDQIPIINTLMEFGYSTDIGAGVFDLSGRDNDIYEKLLVVEGLTHVMDLGESPPPLNVNGNSCKFVISSPNTERLRNFMSDNMELKTFYMPLWTLDEIKQHAKATCCHTRP